MTPWPGPDSSAPTVPAPDDSPGASPPTARRDLPRVRHAAPYSLAGLRAGGHETAIDRFGPQGHSLSTPAKDMGSAGVLPSLLPRGGAWAGAHGSRIAA